MGARHIYMISACEGAAFMDKLRGNVDRYNSFIQIHIAINSENEKKAEARIENHFKVLREIVAEIKKQQQALPTFEDTQEHYSLEIAIAKLKADFYGYCAERLACTKPECVEILSIMLEEERQ